MQTVTGSTGDAISGFLSVLEGALAGVTIIRINRASLVPGQTIKRQMAEAFGPSLGRSPQDIMARGLSQSEIDSLFTSLGKRRQTPGPFSKTPSNSFGAGDVALMPPAKERLKHLEDSFEAMERASLPRMNIHLSSPIPLADGGMLRSIKLTSGALGQLNSYLRRLNNADAERIFKSFHREIMTPRAAGRSGEAGIKTLDRLQQNPFQSNVSWSHEIKIEGSAARIMGHVDKDGILQLDRFLENGLH